MADPKPPAPSDSGAPDRDPTPVDATLTREAVATRGARVFDIKFRLVWSMASFGGALISGIYGAMLPIFYQDYLGVSSYLITISSIIYAVWNAVNDPLFGFLSDASKSEKGRRIPFMRYTAPFLGLTFILVWLADPVMTESAIFWWMLLTMLLYDTAYTIIFLVFSALLPEVTESDQERAKLQSMASAFQLVGMIFGFVVPDLVRPKAGDPSLLPFRLSMVAIGIVGAALIIYTSYKVKERPEFSQVDEPLGLLDSIKFTFKSKSFLILVSGNFMNILFQSLIIGYLFYLADYILEMTALILVAAVFIPLFVGIYMVNIFATRFGVVRTQQLMLLIAGVPLTLLIALPETLILVALMFAGFGFAGPLVLTNALFGQVADEDEVTTGVRREAAYFGINALVTKPAQSIALAIPAIILEATGFVPRAGGTIQPQPESALLGIKIIFGLISGVAMLVEVLILQFYPLHGEYLEEVKRQIMAMHEEKHQAFEQIKHASAAADEPQ